MSYTPIALFTYNRLDCLKQTVEALKANELASESDLYIFSDGSKPNVDSAAVFGVRTYLKTISGFRSIHIKEAEVNQGLANSIIDGVTEIVNKFGRIIVLEDDLVTSHHFLSFMNEALDFYEKEEKVAGIQGWRPLNHIPAPETFFINEVGCWGWATWKRAWDLFEPDGKKLLAQFKTPEQISLFNNYDSYPFYQMLQDQSKGKVDSWAIRWYASVFLNHRLGLQPGHNLVCNVGFNSGTHFSGESFMPKDVLDTKKPLIEHIDLCIKKEIFDNIYIPQRHLECPGFDPTVVRKRHLLKKTVRCFLPYGVVRLYQKYLHK